MRKILALTSIRSEYDLMSRLFQLLRDDKDIDLQLLVSGAHLSPAHGYTIDDVRKDGIHILAEVETLISADSRASRLKTASGLLAGSIDIVKMFQPDLIMFAGVFDPVAHRKALLHDRKPIVTAPQLMQCAGSQPKPVGGLLGGN